MKVGLCSKLPKRKKKRETWGMVAANEETVKDLSSNIVGKVALMCVSEGVREREREREETQL